MIASMTYLLGITVGFIGGTGVAWAYRDYKAMIKRHKRD